MTKPKAACLGDQSDHGGLIAGPGIPTVLINNRPAIVFGDSHVCAAAPVHPPTPVLPGSPTVLIGGRFAARVGDFVGCGARIQQAPGPQRTVEMGPSRV